MDLLFVSNLPPYPLRHPQREFLFQLANELTLRHYVIDLACFYDQPEALADVPRYRHLFRDIELMRLPQIPQAEIKKRFQKSDVIKDSSMAWSPQMWHLLHQWITERRYIAAQLWGGWEVEEYHHLLRLLPQVLVMPQQESARALELAYLHQEKNQQRYWQQQAEFAQGVESRLYRTFKDVMVLKQSHANQIQQQAESCTPHVVPFGVDVDYYVPTGHEPRQPSLLYYADFENPTEVKAALRLCQDIFPVVKRAIAQAQLYILGANPPAEIRQLASDSLMVIGRVPDIRPYFELATAFIYPLEHSPAYPTILLQAMAMMTPMVCSEAAIEDLELAHDQEVLIANSDDEFIRAAIRLMREDQTRQRLALNSRNKLQILHTWDQVVNQVEEVYQQVTQG